MKQKLLNAAVFATTVLVFTACGSNATKESKNSDTTQVTSEHKHSYRCPMDCEKGKTYDKEGRCPVCGMKLEHFDGTGNGLTYKMEYASNPVELEAGKAAVLSFTPKVIGKETEAVALDLQHEKKIHLIVVSNDLRSEERRVGKECRSRQ